MGLFPLRTYTRKILKNDSREVRLTRLPAIYRVLFYAGGILFAFLSYVAGVWAFAVESETWGIAVFGGSLVKHAQAHVLSLFVWTVVCVGLAVVVGTLFQREFMNRIKAEELANLDGLTGLYNHAFFQKRLDEELERAIRYERNLSLIMLDLDNFKTYNDKWGHQEGDRLLMWFSNVLTSSTRNHDIVSRYGGEEFVIILPETSSNEGLVVAQRIVDTTKKLSSATMGKGRNVTVSAGVASYPFNGNNKYTLLNQADAALYSAKTNGKDQALVASSDNIQIFMGKPTIPRIQRKQTDNSTVLQYMASIINQWSGINQNQPSVVEEYAILLGRRMGLTSEELENLRLSMTLRDIGYLCVPASVLTKTAPLDEEDWQTIKKHIEYGVTILTKAGQSKHLLPGIMHHHERYDGSGYPSGLVGNDIPISARIIAIADAYGSMTNHRTYRRAISVKRALLEIKRCEGTQFDPVLAEEFIRIVETHLHIRAA